MFRPIRFYIFGYICGGGASECRNCHFRCEKRVCDMLLLTSKKVNFSHGNAKSTRITLYDRCVRVCVGASDIQWNLKFNLTTFRAAWRRHITTISDAHRTLRTFIRVVSRYSYEPSGVHICCGIYV